MSSDAPAELPESHPVQNEGVKVAMDAIYNWNYESEVDQLRTLYANALERQWVALRDLDWGGEIDKRAFSETFSLGGIPIQQTDFWKGLSEDTRWQISRGTATFMLSNFLHGEQGALMVAAQLVTAVPHMDAKFYASTQTMDEARHVEVFAAYIHKLGEVQPIAPGLKRLLDNVLETDNWLFKLVGMQVVTEGLALFAFRDMRNQTQEPLLKQLLTYVSRDEARHTGYGIKYLNTLVPTMDDQEKADIEDFAFESARLLIDSRAGLALRHSALQIWADAGVDPGEALSNLAKERRKIQESLGRSGGRFGPIRGFVIPTLRTIGLFSDRIRGHFEEMFSANLSGAPANLADDLPELPEDLEAWVNEGYESI